VVPCLTLDRSDWTLDVTHPNVNVHDGWQYASKFSDPDELWTADPPSPVQRLLSETLVTRNLPGSTGPGSWNNQSCVRRRRWVRVMRRRLDIPSLPFMESDGLMYNLDAEGNLVPYRDGETSTTQEMEPMPALTSKNDDYVGKARYLVGLQIRPDGNGGSASGIEIRRTIAKLERAIMELKQGILSTFTKLARRRY
jgi:hypothetical protein